jgi:phage shock protein PspC (stress-responsive transcriptional regulator)
MVGGVAEGLSRHFDIDPLLIRVAFFALTFFGGAGLCLYLIAWLAIPEEGKHDSALSRVFRRDPNRVMAAGLVFGGIVGALALIGAIGFSAPNPIAILVVSFVAIVAVALFSRRGERPPPPPAPGPWPGQDAPRPGVPGAQQTTSAPAPPDVDDSAVGDASPGAPPQATPDRAWWQRPDDTGMGGTPPSAPGVWVPPPPPPAKEHSHLFGITMAMIAIAMGVVSILDQTAFDGDITPSVYPGTALAVIAAALLLGTWYGKSRLLIAAGVIATLATGATEVVGPGPYGDSVYRPIASTSVPSEYHNGVGRLVVHLEQLSDPHKLSGRTIEVTERIGQIEVVVPSTMPVVIDAHVDHGDITGPDNADVSKHGAGAAEIEMSSVAPGGTPTVTLDIDLDFGEIVITQYDCPTTSAASVGLDTNQRIGGSHAAPACH